MSGDSGAGTMVRDVVIGANAKIWKAAQSDPKIRDRFRHVLSHRDVPAFAFSPDDRVWIFSYSRVPRENTDLLSLVSRSNVAEIVYVSSASTNVTAVTDCYEYPRVKKLAENFVGTLDNGKVLTIGLVHDDAEELPHGPNIATSQTALNDFLIDPVWPAGSSRKKNLFTLIDRPFGSRLEQLLFRSYTAAQRVAGSWPCLLRPVDLVLKAIGFRWYGYFAMSNRLWSMTTS